MRIETKQFFLDPATFRRAANRAYWTLLWPVLILGLVGVVGLWVIGLGFISSAPLLVVIAVPFIASQRKVNRVRLSGAFGEGRTFCFDEDGLTEFTPFASTYATYDRFTSFERTKEGIRANSRDRGWALIPQDAFQSTSDHAEVCRHLVRIGKMRQDLSA